MYRREDHVMKPNILAIAFAGLAAGVQAQTPALQIGATYQCATSQSFKVFSCTGPGNADTCDVQTYLNGQPTQRARSTRQLVMALLPVCHPQTPQEAQTGARAASQPDANGFKVGDTVQINTAFGWINANILAINGNNYRVHAQSGADVTKTYPEELHRVGKLTDRDHAAGLYDLHDRVQVNFEGRWVDSEVLTTLGMEYQVKLPGDRAVWAKPENLRYLGPALKPAAPAAGTPPKPGLTSCAGKFEGRYATSGSAFASFTITFRSGKATLTDVGGNDENFECWMGGEKIYLHKPDNPNLDMPIDINNDGTLQTPLGEIRKKGN